VLLLGIGAPVLAGTGGGSQRPYWAPAQSSQSEENFYQYIWPNPIRPRSEEL
jgi:hypothetical protein